MKNAKQTVVVWKPMLFNRLVHTTSIFQPTQRWGSVSSKCMQTQYNAVKHNASACHFLLLLLQQLSHHRKKNRKHNAKKNTHHLHLNSCWKTLLQVCINIKRMKTRPNHFAVEVAKRFGRIGLNPRDKKVHMLSYRFSLTLSDNWSTADHS